MFLLYVVEDNIERKKNWVKSFLKWKFRNVKGNKELTFIMILPLQMFESTDQNQMFIYLFIYLFI